MAGRKSTAKARPPRMKSAKAVQSAGRRRQKNLASYGDSDSSDGEQSNPVSRITRAKASEHLLAKISDARTCNTPGGSALASSTTTKRSRSIDDGSDIDEGSPLKRMRASIAVPATDSVRRASTRKAPRRWDEDSAYEDSHNEPEPSWPTSVEKSQQRAKRVKIFGDSDYDDREYHLSVNTKGARPEINEDNPSSTYISRVSSRYAVDDAEEEDYDPFHNPRLTSRYVDDDEEEKYDPFHNPRLTSRYAADDVEDDSENNKALLRTSVQSYDYRPHLRTSTGDHSPVQIYSPARGAHMGLPEEADDVLPYESYGFVKPAGTYSYECTSQMLPPAQKTGDKHTSTRKSAQELIDELYGPGRSIAEMAQKCHRYQNPGHLESAHDSEADESTSQLPSPARRNADSHTPTCKSAQDLIDELYGPGRSIEDMAQRCRHNSR
ncbi:Uu.00g065950.m01.CDS01 [Anthostomella pinea]|uniref:Uu.00g065950.m01.CDS01 n=1 Tax=Anthostomella pinea TaxID=933095 RepID=A0AAI8YNA0_9PEZI|nr:Uu.00g065950.m01.CDS01 [Anthostomella pinea]